NTHHTTHPAAATAAAATTAAALGLLPQESGFPGFADLFASEKENDDSVKEERSDLKEKSTGNKKANRFHPYSKDKNLGTGEKKGPNRNRVFISNIPYDMKWQAIKDLMREKGNYFCNNPLLIIHFI
uniref:Myelin expression factor 2 n=1 Tax=Sarcophilus harrisii TaxID=9305 RepID=A0A7N4V3G4_SARHA